MGIFTTRRGGFLFNVRGVITSRPKAHILFR